MKINEEKAKKVMNLQEQIGQYYESKTIALNDAIYAMPMGIKGFFMRKYKKKLQNAVDAYYCATEKVREFSITSYDPVTICYEGRPLSTKQDFIFCKMKYQEQVRQFSRSCEWLKVSNEKSFDSTISDLLKELEALFEEETKETVKEE